ncbi:MAG: ribbon-helix-helix protein, CopG family [Actinomycetota bacterium]|nr:ribbon-helix-helix protein, CopG family [Actinomycetota bacterium]
MRTTVSIADELLATARERARRRGQTLGELIEDALRREIAVPTQRSERPPVPVFRGGTGPRPGVDLNSNRSLHETLDDGRDLDVRR